MTSGSVHNFVGRAKEALNPSHIGDWFRENQELLVRYGVAAGIGLLTGFLLKKCSTYVVALLLFAIAIFAAQYIGIIDFNIDWAKLAQTIGIELPESADGAIATLVAFGKENVGVTIAAAIGFLLGLRLA